MSRLYKLTQYVKQEGEVKAVSRLGLIVLMDAALEGIAISRVTPQTECSPTLYNKVKKAAEEIIGKRITV